MHKKLVYAIGGLDKNQPPPYCSAKAFVCDFGSESLTWEELPPMSSPKLIHFGIVSPSDGKLYAYGDAQKEEEVCAFVFLWAPSFAATATP
ncbi:hypothetical protein LguiB_005336 [Lonicera macranthoides]